MATFTESFTSGDNVPLHDPASTTDLTWSHVEGANEGWHTTSNQASPRGDLRGLVVYARAEHDTAASDIYAQFAVTVFSGVDSGGGPCVRFQSAANTSYMAQIGNIGVVNLGTAEVSIVKTVAGTRTVIGAPVTVDITALPKILRVEVEGSTVRAFWDGALVAEQADAEVASGTRGGLFGFESTGEGLGLVVDDFEVGDLAGAGVVRSMAASANAVADAAAAMSVRRPAAAAALLAADGSAAAAVRRPLVMAATLAVDAAAALGATRRLAAASSIVSGMTADLATDLISILDVIELAASRQLAADLDAGRQLTAGLDAGRQLTADMTASV